MDHGQLDFVKQRNIDFDEIVYASTSKYTKWDQSIVLILSQIGCLPY